VAAEEVVVGEAEAEEEVAVAGYPHLRQMAQEEEEQLVSALAQGRVSVLVRVLVSGPVQGLVWELGLPRA
jgi:hypothetical protein